MELAGKAKYEDVVHRLRSDIVEGIYSPGNRLPNRSDIGQQFGVGMATVQKALDMLTEDGFIRARAGAGTFVVDNPPHLCNYGVVIPQTSRWSRYYMALRRAIEAINVNEAVCFKEYEVSMEVASPSMVRLCNDVRNHRLAGLILFGSGPDLTVFGKTPVWNEPGVARVVLEDMPEYGLPVVTTNELSFIDRSVEYLFSQNRRRIAHLCMDYSWGHLDVFEKNLRDRGVEIRPYWIMPIPSGPIFRSATYLVNMMLQMEKDKRPDSLIIHDDNLVEHAASGLMAAGVKVPEELDVVAKCNFPAPVPTMLPIKHLGFDFRLLIKRCLRVLRMQQNGEEPTMLTKIPAMFESELAGEVHL